MKVGLIDVDGHNFPNLALMRISAWHKEQGDEVEWWQPPMFAPWYDVVVHKKGFQRYLLHALRTTNRPKIREYNEDGLRKGGETNGKHNGREIDRDDGNDV